ncbi:MAG: hypothetical protein ACLRSW_10890 [Christensenellaceae bacterium]
MVDGLTGLGIAPVAISLSLFRKLVLMLTLTLTLPRFLGRRARLRGSRFPTRGRDYFDDRFLLPHR